MTKEKILETTGLSEDQFYDQYPDQASFCADYPDLCSELNQPLKVLAPIVDNYNLPKELITNNLQTVPIKDFNQKGSMRVTLSPKQTMKNVGGIGASYNVPLSGYSNVSNILKDNNEENTFANRKKLAENYGIKNYTGTPSQDMQLVDLTQSEMKEGGIHINPANKGKFTAMKTYKSGGGYYGMDGKFHKTKGSGTYVMNSGYYFDAGGNTTAAPAASSTPPSSADSSSSSSFSSNEAWRKDDAGGGYLINPDYNPKFGTDGDSSNNYPDDGGDNNSDGLDKNPSFDYTGYSSNVDPDTGFVTYSKDDRVLTNIKKQDPYLWDQLKEEGHGARWETGQTDIQKFGKTAGRIGDMLGQGIEVAGAIGSFIAENKKKKNMENAAINMGSTAGTYTNPQGSSKGDYGVTGSSYGAFKPYNTGAFSYKGMYGKYGMEIPNYAVGGFYPQLETLSDYGLGNTPEPINKESYVNIITPNPIIDNTRSVKPYISNKNNNESNTNDSENSLKKFIASKESEGKGGYKALPWITDPKTHEKKLASSAVGKYQFLWNTHKSDIAKVTGVKSKEGFLNNPQAQEQFFDYWNTTTLTPVANKFKSKLNLDIPINDIKSAIHFLGETDAWKFFSKGIIKKDAFGSTPLSYMKHRKNGGEIVEMDENEIQQFLSAGGQLEFID